MWENIFSAQMVYKKLVGTKIWEAIRGKSFLILCSLKEDFFKVCFRCTNNSEKHTHLLISDKLMIKLYVLYVWYSSWKYRDIFFTIHWWLHSGAWDSQCSSLKQNFILWHWKKFFKQSSFLRLNENRRFESSPSCRVAFQGAFHSSDVFSLFNNYFFASWIAVKLQILSLSLGKKYHCFFTFPEFAEFVVAAVEIFNIALSSLHCFCFQQCEPN